MIHESMAQNRNTMFQWNILLMFHKKEKKKPTESNRIPSFHIEIQ